MMIKKIKAILISLGVVVVASLPIDIFFVIKSFLHPEGFWQKLVVDALGVWLLGGLQILMLFGGAWMIYQVWVNWN